MRLLAAHVPRRTDLGRIDPACTAERHGTYTAYRYGCSCPHAREAARLYRKRCRHGLLAPGFVDSCGTRRRIEALLAIGHTGDEIAAASGGRFDGAYLRAIRRHSTVTVPIRELIKDVYVRLSVRPGSSAITRKRALARGYATPVQWGADIDDPDAVPDPLEGDQSEADVIDEDVVERALNGERIDLSDAELIAAVQIGTARGLGISVVAERLHLNHLAAKRLLNGELPPNRRRRANVTAELRRDPHRPNKVIAAELGVSPQLVSAVRRELTGQNRKAS